MIFFFFCMSEKLSCHTTQHEELGPGQCLREIGCNYQQGGQQRLEQEFQQSWSGWYHNRDCWVERGISISQSSLDSGTKKCAVFSGQKKCEDLVPGPKNLCSRKEEP